MAVLSFFVIVSQLIKYVVPLSKPVFRMLNTLPVLRVGANRSIFSLDCSSSSPLPGQNQQIILSL